VKLDVCAELWSLEVKVPVIFSGTGGQTLLEGGFKGRMKLSYKNSERKRPKVDAMEREVGNATT